MTLMKPFSYTEYTEVKLDVLATVKADGKITVHIIVHGHGKRAERTSHGMLDHGNRGWRVFDQNDQHTGIIEVTKHRAIQRFTRQEMAQVATWAVHDTLDSLIPADPAGAV